MKRLFLLALFILIGCKQLSSAKLSFTTTCPRCVADIQGFLKQQEGVYFTRLEKQNTIVLKFDKDIFNLARTKKKLTLDYKLFESKETFYFQNDSMVCCLPNSDKPAVSE